MLIASFTDPAFVLSMCLVVVQLCDRVWSQWALKANMCRFFIVCFYLYCCWRHNYKFTRLTPSPFCVRLKTDPECPLPYVLSLYLCFMIKMRSSCLFCWYWWNHGPSLFTPSYNNKEISKTWYDVNEHKRLSNITLRHKCISLTRRF